MTREIAEWLFQPYSIGEFVSRFWQRNPLHIPRANTTHYLDVLTLEDLDRVLTCDVLHPDDLRLVRDGEPVSQELYVHRATAYGVKVGEVAPQDVLALYRSKCTLVFEALDRRHPPLADLRLWAERALGGTAWTNCYLTPADAGGFSAHYDTHDVLVLQVHGAKHWEVRGPAVEFPGPLGPHRAVDVVPAEPLLFNVTLRQGDLLYLPRGFVHRAFTSDVSSAHVTLGVQARTWRDMLVDMVDFASLRDPSLRAAVPPPVSGASNDAVFHATELLARLAASESTLNSAPRKHFGRLDQRQILRGQLVQLDQIHTISEESIVMLRPNSLPTVSSVDDRTTIVVGKSEIELPASVAPVMELLLKGRPVKVACLPIDGAGIRSQLVRRLVEEGVLIIEDA